jgi:hypothetical protein
VPSLDDERFEAYLKQFRPLAPEALPTKAPERATRRSFIFAVYAGVAACVLAVALSLYFAAKARHSRDGANTATMDRNVTQQPLTVRRANALLAQSPSLKDALDGLAFHSQSTQLRNGELSALSVLSEEKNKL